MLIESGVPNELNEAGFDIPHAILMYRFCVAQQDGFICRGLRRVAHGAAGSRGLPGTRVAGRERGGHGLRPVADTAGRVMRRHPLPVAGCRRVGSRATRDPPWRCLALCSRHSKRVFRKGGVSRSLGIRDFASRAPRVTNFRDRYPAWRDGLSLSLRGTGRGGFW